MKPGSIIPSNVASLRSLTVTMAVMSYLACLAIGALILVDRAVTSWTSGLSQEMTVQVAHVRGADIDAEVEKAQAIAAGLSRHSRSGGTAGGSRRQAARALARHRDRSKGCRCRG